ncbi:hypothetical protein LAJ19_14980 (plasmid) [Deinococcus taeanensis]|uniref:hypothetical protein n=1 Tax=Deinococcus taeanensis TaxID=2737050 RepID=UPI001CDD012D|nr:hypothetical protein [Deinococcus taeanensis]UBV44110.1 hypothetical protein LAJ19_14980 [Deinococcus taeanensis]
MLDGSVVPGVRASGRNVVQVLPAVPPVMPDSAGRPAALLQLRLSRLPSLNEASVAPLMTGGQLTVTLGLSLDGAVTSEGDLERHPLFCTSATFQCGGVTAAGTGVTARATLSVPLDPTQAFKVLGILRGAAPRVTALPLNIAVTYPVTSAPHRVTISGASESIYWALVEQLDPSQDGRRFNLEALEAAVRTLAQAGTLHVEGGDSRSALKGFLRTLAFVQTTGNGEHLLSPTAPSPTPLHYAQTVTDQAEGHFEYTVDLGEVLAGAFAQVSSEGHIQLVALGPDGISTPVPARAVASGRTRAALPDTMLRVGQAALSPQLALRPQSGVVASHLAIANAAHPGLMISPAVHHTVLDHAVFEAGGDSAPTERALPRVLDAAAPLWADHTNAGNRWYAPECHLVTPAPTDATETSPFLFEFETSGHDLMGRPGLNARIRLTLDVGMGEATREAWQTAGRPEASPVPLLGESVQLELPFRDGQGNTRSQVFAADELVREGTRLVAAFRLMDDWARLAYGALSTPAFQAQPMRVRLNYQFEAYTPVSNKLEWLGFNVATLAVATNAREVKGARGPVLDLRHRAMHLPSGVLAFEPEPASTTRTRSAKGSPVAATHRLVPLAGVQASHALATVGVRPHTVALPIRPEFALSPAVLDRFPRKYSVTTLARTITREVLVPCATLGEFYRQQQDGQTRAIGCQDSFRLGQTEFRQYERLPELNRPTYTVWRSLQRPGRFLVAPTSFSFTRFGPEEGDRAYRPAVYLYSSIDPNEPANSRCMVMGRLQADLIPFERAALLGALRTRHRDPTLEYLNEINADCEIAFSIPATSGAPLEVNAVRLWDGFQVTIRSDVDGVPPLRAMLETGALVGTARFTLPDGTRINTDLHLDLRRVVGPSAGGAVQPDVTDGRLHLTNRAERAADIRQVSYGTPDDPSTVLPIGQRLASGASVSLDIPVGATDVLCDYSLDDGPANLTEIRSFIEDIHTNVVFLNLANMAQHGLDHLTLTARIQGLPEEYSAQLAEGGTANVNLVLPLTSYLLHPTLEFQVTKVAPDGNSTRTPWLAWPLSSLGHVVPLSWDLLQPDEAP